MTWPLRQSTASQEIPLGPFVDSTDGNTAETGLTIANTDIKLQKFGATTQANKNSGGATHIATGDYYAVLDATDSDTVGPMRVKVHVAGALPVWLDCMVFEEAVYDDLFAASAAGYLKPTTASRTLDVTAAGEAGLDFANVAIPDGPVPALGIVEGGTAQSATSTTLVGRAAGAVADDAFNGCVLQVFGSTQGYWQTVLIADTTLSSDTFTVAAWPAATPSGTITYRIFGTPAGQLTGTQTFNMVGNITGNLSGSVGSVTGAVGSVTGAVGSVTGAVGSVTGNVGGNVAGSVASVTGLTASDVGAIKTKTDSLTFTQAGHVDANIQRINDVTITGNGGTGTEFSV